MPLARPFTPGDVASSVTPGQLSLHGDQVVYTLRQCDERGERTDLWTVSLRGGDQQRLTRSPGRDHCPRISPSGQQVAFLRGDPAQVHILPLNSGSPVQVSSFSRGVLDLAWSPDGSWLAVVAPDETSPSVVSDGAATPTAIVVRRADWRADGASDGGLNLYPQHVHRLAADGTSTQRLTSGPWSTTRPRVGADDTVYFLADTDSRGDVARSPQVHCVSVPGSVRRCTDLPGGVVRFHLVNDALRVLGYTDDPRHEDMPPQLFDVSSGTELLADAGGWLGRLGEESDLHEWQTELDDAGSLTTVSSGGDCVPIDVASGRRLLAGPVACGAVAASGSARVAVLSLGTGLQAPDLYALDDDGPRRLTDHGSWVAPFAQLRWSSLEVDGAAGPISVHLLLPPAQVTVRATVVSLHGGPISQSGAVPPIEALLLASAGYQVAMPNIRGSIDRDPEWARALDGQWGDADASDVLAVCDALVASGAGRLGVMGRSYGGFLTQWLIGTTDVFAAAVSENGVANQIAAWGSSDTGPSYSEAARLGSAVTTAGAAQLWECSPLRNVAQVHTPLLMLQAADDRTCPASDNEQFFVALRTLGREVEYVLYPEESHQMQATGRLDRRIDRHQRMLDWFARHLG